MKRKKYKAVHVTRRNQSLRNRAAIIGVGALCVAVIVFAAVFIGKQLTSQQPVAETESSQSSQVSKQESGDEQKNSETQQESTASSSSETSSKTESSTASQTEVSIDPNGPEYQKKYPDLYVTDRPKMQVLDDADKIVYLTFDDGPSDLTAPLLDVLKKYNAKATFFNCCQSDYQKSFAPLMKRCVDEGHTVAVHSYSHKMREVYASVDAYLDDFYKMYMLIEETTGQKPANFFRFPGGSSNGYNQQVYEDIIKEMTRRGFVYYDWDGDSGDANAASVSGSVIYSNTMDAIHRGCNVILMHNIFGKETTLEQVGKIIETAQKEGYVFKAMDGTLDPTHGYLMTNKVFIPAALESPYIHLSDWRLEKEGVLKD